MYFYIEFNLRCNACLSFSLQQAQITYA